jgi:hypothetical protein
MRPRVIASGAAGLVLLLGGAAMYTVANADSPGEGMFDEAAWNADGDCLAHQDGGAGTRYKAGSDADTGRVLRMMRYYTSHGNKAFCDGAAANDDDKAWAKLYVELGGNPANVKAVQGG